MHYTCNCKVFWDEILETEWGKVDQRKARWNVFFVCWLFDQLKTVSFMHSIRNMNIRLYQCMYDLIMRAVNKIVSMFVQDYKKCFNTLWLCVDDRSDNFETLIIERIFTQPVICVDFPLVLMLGPPELLPSQLHRCILQKCYTDAPAICYMTCLPLSWNSSSRQYNVDFLPSDLK